MFSFKSTETTSTSRIAPFDVPYKISDVTYENKGTRIVFVSPIGGKIQQNVVLWDVKEIHAAIEFFLNLRYLPTETIN